MPTAGLSVGLSITPPSAERLRTVTVRLRGDLTHVAPTIAAVFWIDQEAGSEWRTVAWFADVGDRRQQFTPVADAGPTPAPDAVFVARDQPVDLRVDRLRAGTYRVCRYVPLSGFDRVTAPTENPAYVCASLVVDNDVHPGGAQPASTST